MKRARFWLLASAVLALVQAFVPDWRTGILGAMALPFTALGWVMRTLSLSGGVGNVLAWTLYGLLCLLPVLFWLRSQRRREDGMLLLLSGILALVLYYMINPNLRHSYWQNDVGDLVYALPFWSILVAWGVLKLIVNEEVLERNIYRALRIFLLLCAAGCLMDCLGGELKNLLWQVKRYAGMDYGFSSGPTLLILLIRYLARLAEGVLTALVLYRGTALLDALEADPFSEACVEAAGEISRRCREALAIITLSSAFVNLAQLLMHGMLLDIQMELALPVMGMAVCFAMLAVTKLLVRGKALQDDNDLFV